MEEISASVGIIKMDGHYLIACRPDGKEFAGYWEFPGGKKQQEESPIDTLKRELKEELNIHVKCATFFKEFAWQYSTKKIHLTFFLISAYSGQLRNNENQKYKWVTPEALRTYKFLDANKYIVNLLTLPKEIVITPECNDISTWMQRAKTHLKNKNTILRLRFSNRLAPTSEQLSEIVDISAENKSYVIFDPNDFEYIVPTPYTGIHLNRHQISRFIRSDNQELIFGASVHDEKELEEALALGVDYVTISPVLSTQSHPDVSGIGWEKFAKLANSAQVLSYALGGMSPSMLSMAQQYNAHGVAGLRSFW